MEFTFEWNAKTKVEFLKKLPSEIKLAESLGFKPEKFLVIYDKHLAKMESARRWLAEFPLTYAVSGGERIKDLHTFPGHVKKIFKLLTPFSARSLCIIAAGGGTVGDFAGFLSCVLKRGVPFIQIPSTLLAAMDSAHGGKTALNLNGYKNQIGSFYPADRVLVVRSLFESLPGLQIQSAGGELAKMALLEGGKLFARFKDEFTLTFEWIWELLPHVIQAKYRIVEKDPFERRGERQILNFGHSLGHVLESYHGLAHGVAVGEGLIFAIYWSEHAGYLTGKESKELVSLLADKIGILRPQAFVKAHRSMSRSKLKKLVFEDKKLTDARHISFVFLNEIGSPFRKVVTVEALLTETQRQGWTSI